MMIRTVEINLWRAVIKQAVLDLSSENKLWKESAKQFLSGEDGCLKRLSQIAYVKCPDVIKLYEQGNYQGIINYLEEEKTDDKL